MSTYAVIYTYSDDTALRDAVRPEHREYLSGLDGLLAAGAWTPAEAPGGLLLFRVADKATVQGYVEKDPFSLAGVITDVQIREWGPALGAVAESLR